MDIHVFLKYSIFVSLIVLLVYTILLFIFIDQWRFGFVFILSTGFGFGLKFGDLGYTVAFRHLIKKGSLMRMRTLFVIFFVGTFLSGIFTTLDAKALFDKKQKVKPTEESIGLSLLIGSFVFGFGMNLAGCCASGTLVGIGSGSIKAIVTLLFFYSITNHKYKYVFFDFLYCVIKSMDYLHFLYAYTILNLMLDYLFLLY